MKEKSEMNHPTLSGPLALRGALLVLWALVAGCFDLSALPERFTDFGSVATETGSGTSDAELAESGQPCEQDGDCQSSHCAREVCCDAGDCCASDEVCEGGYACDRTSFTCRASCKSGEVDQDAWCMSGYHCDANTCFEDLPVGVCNEPSDCSSGKCLGSYCCEHAGLCCVADADCPELFDGCSTDNTRTCVFSVQTLPDTGQTKCRKVTGVSVDCGEITPSNDYFGQDGHYPRQPRSFAAVEDDRVRDEVTELTWAVEMGPASRWSQAVSYCGALSLGSEAFRLPTRFELLGLLDFGSTATVGLPAEFGASSETSLVWTATELAGEEASTAWAVDVVAGTVLRVSKDSVLPRALCVEAQP
jgi:hypothetical protein